MIQVLNRAFDIIELLAVEPIKELGLKEIAENLELNPGTCANILKTMVDRQYVVQVGKKGKYKLGTIFKQLGESKQNFNGLISLADAEMKKLAEELNEGVIISILIRNKRIIIHDIKSKQELQVINKIENIAYKTSTGRLLLAFLGEKEIIAFVNKYGIPEPGLWPEAEDKEDLLIEFERIRKKELCIQTSPKHITGIATPIYLNNRVIASLGVYMPESRFIGDFKEKAFMKIKEYSNNINHQLLNKSRNGIFSNLPLGRASQT